MTSEFFERVNQVYQHYLALPANKRTLFLEEFHSWVSDVATEVERRLPQSTPESPADRFVTACANRNRLDCRFRGFHQERLVLAKGVDRRCLQKRERMDRLFFYLPGNRRGKDRQHICIEVQVADRQLQGLWDR